MFSDRAGRVLARIFPALAACAVFYLTGCAGAGVQRLRDIDMAQPGRGVHVTGMPFEKQRAGQCGPAALTSLLRYWGQNASQEDMAGAVYSPKLKGSLGFDLWRYARQRGLVALELRNFSPDGMAKLLSQGVPVLVNLHGKSPQAQHYALVTGFDRPTGFWIIQDGVEAGRVLTQKSFLQAWTRSDRWALVVFPPNHKVTGMDAAFHLQAAQRLAELSRPRDAQRQVDEALKTKPADSAIWIQAGDLYAAAGNNLAAEKSYRRAMELDGNHPTAPNNLAVLLMKDAARADEAEKWARTSLALCAKYPGGESLRPYALDTLGTILSKEGRVQESRKALREALALLPRDAELAVDIQKRLGPDNPPSKKQAFKAKDQ